MSNQGFIDPYSIGHAAMGVIARGVGLTLGTTLVLHTAFELLENYYLKEKLSSVFPDNSKDTALNILGDFACTALGWYINDKSSSKKTDLLVDYNINSLNPWK